MRDRFGIADGAEITIEANPGPDERGDPAALRRAGVTRISFGAQSLDDGELRRLGRRHRAVDVAAAVEGARAAGIASVNLDLLYDVPDSTLADLGGDARRGAGPRPGPPLAVRPDARRSRRGGPDRSDGRPPPDDARCPSLARAARGPRQDEDRAAAQYDHAAVRLAAAGFRGYEISNWARPGHESRHNLAYWQRRPHEASAPARTPSTASTRRWNAARLDGYVGGARPPGRRRLPPGGEEAVDADAATAEAVILGLRLDTGVPLSTADEPPLPAPSAGPAPRSS